MNSKNIPSLFIQSKGEKSTKVALLLTRAKKRNIIRITGGCGNMEKEFHQDMDELYKSLLGFEGAILFGGTRMIDKNNPDKIIPGITEVPPRLREQCPNAVILGVIPKTTDIELSESGLIVSNKVGSDFLTIAHPNQDSCLIVQESVDKLATWETEFEECMNITHELREYVGWNSLLISYNGGTVTEKEILATAERGWPALLIKGSGRKTDQYANDEKFLQSYPNVQVTAKDWVSIKKNLYHLGFVDDVADAMEHSLKLTSGGKNE